MRFSGKQTPPAASRRRSKTDRRTEQTPRSPEKEARKGERRDPQREDIDNQGRRASDEQQRLFGKWLETRRKQSDLSQDQCCNLARASDLRFKLNKSDLSRIENGYTPLGNLYDKLPVLAQVLNIDPLLMYQKAYLKPPAKLEAGSASDVLEAAIEWERRAQYLEKLFVFCTNRILTALDQPEISVEDLAHLRPTADELAKLRAADERPPTS